LQGDPGDGKSTFMLTVAALLTKRREGCPFAEPESPPEPMNVIYQTTEDDAEDTVVPRFIKANGDRDRLLFINEKDKPIFFDDDRIEAAIRGYRSKDADPRSAFLLYRRLNSFDNDDASCPIIQRYLENFTCPARDTDPNRRYGWMDEIDSCQLSSFLKKLNQSDIELITLYAFDGYTVTEIAQLLSVTQPTISKKITRIQKNLKKIFGEAMD
jgi:RNA polymerase sigma factor (sigma-70 family)